MNSNVSHFVRKLASKWLLLKAAEMKIGCFDTAVAMRASACVGLETRTTSSGGDAPLVEKEIVRFGAALKAPGAKVDRGECHALDSGARFAAPKAHRIRYDRLRSSYRAFRIS